MSGAGWPPWSIHEKRLHNVWHIKLLWGIYEMTGHPEGMALIKIIPWESLWTCLSQPNEDYTRKWKCTGNSQKATHWQTKAQNALQQQGKARDITITDNSKWPNNPHWIFKMACSSTWYGLLITDNTHAVQRQWLIKVQASISNNSSREQSLSTHDMKRAKHPINHTESIQLKQEG